MKLIEVSFRDWKRGGPKAISPELKAFLLTKIPESFKHEVCCSGNKLEAYSKKRRTLGCDQYTYTLFEFGLSLSVYRDKDNSRSQWYFTVQ